MSSVGVKHLSTTGLECSTGSYKVKQYEGKNKVTEDKREEAEQGRKRRERLLELIRVLKRGQDYSDNRSGTRSQGRGVRQDSSGNQNWAFPTHNEQKFKCNTFVFAPIFHELNSKI